MEPRYIFAIVVGILALAVFVGIGISSVRFERRYRREQRYLWNEVRALNGQPPLPDWY